MSFCLKISKARPYQRLVDLEFKDLKTSDENCIWVADDLKGQDIHRGQFNGAERIILGDLIEESDFDSMDLADWLQTAKGNFIVIVLKSDKVQIASSLFGVLPVFFTERENLLLISDRIEHIAELDNSELSLSKENILERLFFNYSITNRTLISSIYQFPVNTICSYEDKVLKYQKVVDIFSFYKSQPESLKTSRKRLVKLFAEQVQKYLPKESYASAFTSGFDGRCVVAAGLKGNRQFGTFSFGTSKASDVYIPKLAAKANDFRYECILLDQAYLEQEFAENAEEMVLESHGMSTISRAHYRYGAKHLKKNYRYLLSGNFGSELFRSAHLDGVMTSKLFYHWLKEDLPESLAALKKQFPELSYLNDGEFGEAYQKLSADLALKKKSIPDIPLNAQLYFFMWSETIRNYFGPELTMQQNYIYHRSPFLDFTFFKALQKTEFSGAYGNFRERNLLKRMKGQLFYAYYLKSTHKGLFRALTGKGYKPSDLLNVFGLLRIAASKLTKKKAKSDIDPLLATAGYEKFKNHWIKKSTPTNQPYFQSLPFEDDRAMKTILSIFLFNKNLLGTINED